MTPSSTSGAPPAPPTDPARLREIEERIARFETMVRPGADPNNDMAWFSLGRAYADAGRHADAAGAYLRSVEINPAMSKSWQLAGASLIFAGQRERAVEVLTKGYTEAGARGDRMPQRAMGELLASVGAAAPAGAETVEDAPLPEGTFIDRKSGRPGTKMARPPFKGPVGAWIFENVSRETWEEWIKQGTKVINELRLDLSREQDSDTYDKYMREYVGIDDELYAQLMGRK